MNNAPTIFIRQAVNGKYYWILCLSENSKNPSCKSPAEYGKLYACRQSAMRFCKHLTSKIKIVSCDEIVIEDQVGDLRKRKKKVNNVKTNEVENGLGS